MSPVESDTETLVRSAYWRITDGPRQPVRITEIRRELRDLPATAVEAAITRLAGRRAASVHAGTVSFEGPAS